MRPFPALACSRAAATKYSEMRSRYGLEAAENALQRLYPQFHLADHSGWDKVYTKAKQGAPDALKAVGDDGEPAKNPVCKAILAFIAVARKERTSERTLKVRLMAGRVTLLTAACKHS